MIYGPSPLRHFPAASAGSIGRDICVKIRWQGRGREGWESGGGVKSQVQFPSAQAMSPRDRQCHLDHSWELRWHTFRLDLEIRLRGMACVHSLLKTDMMVKCNELVRLSVTHGSGCVKTCIQNMYYYTGATEYLHFIARNDINECIQWALHVGTSN